MEDVAGARALLDTRPALGDGPDADVSYGCLLYKVRGSVESGRDGSALTGRCFSGRPVRRSVAEIHERAGRARLQAAFVVQRRVVPLRAEGFRVRAQAHRSVVRSPDAFHKRIHFRFPFTR